MYSEIDSKNVNNYITHVMIGGKKVIPSNNFEIGENKYLLLEILKSSEDGFYLKIIGVMGTNKGNLYFIPKWEFESKTLRELETVLIEYKH